MLPKGLFSLQLMLHTYLTKNGIRKIILSILIDAIFNDGNNLKINKKPPFVNLGSFTIYVYDFLHIFDHPPTGVFYSYTINV